MEIIRGKEGRAANKAASEENLRRIRMVKEYLCSRCAKASSWMGGEQRGGEQAAGGQQARHRDPGGQPQHRRQQFSSYNDTAESYEYLIILFPLHNFNMFSSIKSFTFDFSSTSLFRLSKPHSLYPSSITDSEGFQSAVLNCRSGLLQCP